MRPQLTLDQVEAVRRWAAGVDNIASVRLFGSRAEGKARPGSDVDLALTIEGSDEEAFDRLFLNRPVWRELL